MADLPEGFVLDSQPKNQGLPEGFVLDVDPLKSARDALALTNPSVSPEASRGSMESFATLATAAPAEVLAGVAGIAQSLNPFAEEGAGAAAVEATREALTFNPKTAEGKKNLEAVAGNDVVQAIGRALQGTETSLGDAGFDLAGPIGGAIG